MAEYILIVFVIFVVLYALIKGTVVNINVTVKQEFSAEDRQLLEDIYNRDGDVDSKYSDTMNAVDEAVKAINDIMLGEDTEDING